MERLTEKTSYKHRSVSDFADKIYYKLAAYEDLGTVEELGRLKERNYELENELAEKELYPNGFSEDEMNEYGDCQQCDELSDEIIKLLKEIQILRRALGAVAYEALDVHSSRGTTIKWDCKDCENFDGNYCKDEKKCLECVEDFFIKQAERELKEGAE